MSQHHLKIFLRNRKICLRNYILGYSEISVITWLGLKAVLGKTLLQVSGSAIPVFIQLCLFVLIYAEVQLLQNFLEMPHFNRTINSMLRGCIEIDGQFLFIILSRDGSSSDPPTETLKL